MTRDQARRLAGRIFVARFPQSWKQIDLERFPVANYIVFRDVLGPTFEASRQRILEAREILAHHKIDQPVFMMDEEGGRVTQLSAFFEAAPSARAVAKALAPEAARTLYGYLGAYLARLGICVNLAPCVDVNTEPLNPIIGTRALGAAPALVSVMACKALAAMQPSVSCVAKHFPGHGMTKLDSHLALPVVEEPRERLEHIHLEPFRAAIRAGVRGIMVSHCLYTSLQQDGLPASLSRAVVTDCLRRDLGFTGTVITDSLDMRAITETVPSEKAAELALDAGCDLLLYTEISERFVAAFERIVDLAVTVPLTEERIRNSVMGKSLAEYCRTFEEVIQAGNRASLPDEPRRQAYLDLAHRVRQEAVKVTKGQARLPVSLQEAAIVVAPAALIEKMRPHIRVLTDASAGGYSAGKPVMLWLMEPLVLHRSVADLRALAASSPLSILVTSYQELAEELKDVDVAVVTDDTSPHTEDLIIGKLLGSDPCSRST
ncbi:MAG TPA: glycoside hydrolase family 3 N-terminal domain-containing protein [bacterium]|nr:glycoside hydrolase family 3 N-terminal domain-containing protein [bacterium]